MTHSYKPNSNFCWRDGGDYTDEDAVRAIREAYPGLKGRNATGLYHVYRSQGLGVLESAKRVFLVVVDLDNGGSGDASATVRRLLGREPETPGERECVRTPTDPSRP